MRRRVTATPLTQESLWAREFRDGQTSCTRWGWSGRMGFYPNAVSGLVRGQLWKSFDNRSVTAGTPTKGSGHFRAKIYSKTEAPVMRQHTAKKHSVFHTELLASWPIKVLKIDMPHVPRQWRGLSWPPFARSGWLMEAKSKSISAPGCGFPPEGLYLLGWDGLCQSQQPVEKSARFLRRALKSLTLRLSV